MSVVTSRESEAGDLGDLKSSNSASLHLENSQEAADVISWGGRLAL